MIRKGIYPANPILRQEIKIELTVQPIYTPIEKLSVTSLIKEVIGEKINLPSEFLDCISIHETAAEKWAALARRIADMERQPKNLDKAIVRHLFDLHQMETKQGINDYFEKLIPQTILRDREHFRTSSKHFYENTLSELQYGLDVLVKNPLWAENYNDFIHNMVFSKERPEFNDTLVTLSKLSERALRTIHQRIITKQ